MNNGIAFQDAVNDLLINPASPLQMLAAASSGVYWSSNGGSSWTLTSLSSSSALTLALKPSTPNTVFAGLSFGGIRISTNFGMTWAAASAGLPSTGTVMALAVNPVTQTTAYAGLAYPFAVFKTTTAGTTNTWARVVAGINQIQINALEAIPGSATTFLAATNSLGVQKTTNSGASFANSNTGLPSFFFPQDFDSFNATYVVVTGFGATAFSTNQGASWTQFTASGAPTSGTDVQVDKTNKNHIEVLTFNGIAVTTNGGATWTTKNPACFQLFTLGSALAMQPSNGQVSILISNTGVYRTTNGWTTCVRIASGVPNFLVGVEWDPVNPAIVIVFGNGASKSTNGGASFTAMPALAPGTFIFSLFVNPANNMNIVATREGTGVAQSTNGGTSFTPITNSGLVSPSNFTSVLKVGTTIAVGTNDNSVPVIVP